MEKSKVIDEFIKFINVIEQKITSSLTSSPSSTKYLFHRYLGGDLNSTKSKFGEIFFILQSSLTVSKQELTIKEINNLFEQKIQSNSFLMPSDSEFTSILNYFFRNRDELTIDRKEIIAFLQEKILNLQNSVWIENQNVFSFGDGNGNSIQPDCTINFMKKSDSIAFIFQINNLNLIFNESKEISNLNKKISLLNKKIERNNQKGNINKNIENKKVSNEKTIQKLKNALNSTKNEFKTKISQLYENLQRIESENAELLSENNQFKLETQRLSDLIQKIEQDNKNLIEEKEEIDEANDLLKENLEESNIKMSDLSDEILSLENLNSQLKSSNDQLSDQNKALKVKIRKNTSKIKEILNGLDE